MFTPEGYWSWSEVVDASSIWTLQIVAASIAPELTIDQIENAPYKCETSLVERLVSSQRVENLNEARFSMGLLRLWVLANYMDTYDAVLCSPEGRTLRCPPIIKAHGDAFDWWVWPLSREKMSHGEATGYFEAFRSGKFHIGDACARFCAIDYETGTVRLKPNTVKLLSTSSYGHNAGDADDEIVELINEQIRPIIGWSICWNANSVPKTTKELFEGLGFTGVDWALFEKTEVGQQSSGKNKNDVLECVMAAFPNGKGDVTWHNVEAKVGYSRRSIVRALKENGLHSKWATAGQSQ